MRYTEEQLSELRAAVGKMMSPKRYAHTLAVEAEAAKIGAFFLPGETDCLRAAALLHDVTKEMSPALQAELCQKAGMPLKEEDFRSEATLHEKSAPARIMLEFPLFATPVILDAVRQHTTGSAKMTVFDKIIFLADITEPTRTYANCVQTREWLWERLPTAEDGEAILDQAILSVISFTLRLLVDRSIYVEPKTVAAYNRLIVTTKRAEQEGKRNNGYGK